MFRIVKAAVVATTLALALAAAPAQAVFISGSITVADGVAASGLPSPPSPSAVSGLTGIVHDGNGLSSGCTGSFVGSCGALNAVMTDWVFAGPYPNIIVVNGFTFDLTSVHNLTPTPLTCDATAGTCHDALTISLVGVVSKAGFDDTAFTGQLSFSGSCTGSGTTCTGDISGGYTYSLSATGHQAPEPMSLLLIGTALAGLGFARRKSA